MQCLEPALARPLTQDLMGSHGRVEALWKNRCQLATLVQVANQAARAVRDQHRAWLGDVPNPARQIWCFADHRLASVPAVATLAHEPNSGDDSDPNVRRWACVDRRGRGYDV